MSNKTKNKKGVSIYLALIIVVIFLAMSFGLTGILLSLKKTIRGTGDSINTLAAADTGVEYMLYLEKQCWFGVPPTCQPGSVNCTSNCHGLINGHQEGPVLLDSGATYKARIIRECGLNTITSTSSYKGTERSIKFTVGKYMGGIATNTASGRTCTQVCSGLADDCQCTNIGVILPLVTDGQYYKKDDMSCGKLPGGCGFSMVGGIIKTCPAAPPSYQTAWTYCNCTSTPP